MRIILFTIPSRRRTIWRMRVILVLLAFVLLLIEFGGRARSTASSSAVNTTTPVARASVPKAHVDFDTQLKPMLQSTCMPCHFSGGQMYERLPFDKPATIRKLGT